MRRHLPTVTATVTAAATAALAGFVLAASAPALAHDGHDHDDPVTRPAASAAHSRAGAGAELARMRRDLARYTDVEVALADGYVPVSPCEVSPEGGMGVHYLNPALVGSTDPLAPAVLLYEPTADGGARLLGAEWFAVDADQDLATDDDRPSLLGRAFDGPMLGHSPDMPVHYDLHVWLFEPNPSGVFAAWNPRVDCQG
ncbi:hypothetical protein [Aquipuribacter nitratireducens]|uniref:Uncharacterized protein n=1 Tax=Aquipuribacter nitratireducens TaxID=650104 RepID=A0ABW0GJR8_9MICO